ncbi:MAG: N-terminal double-transrane protein [Bacteroidetes bacterium]|jgi:hypothetical protein|nr:N-terminal double-transrane protein [Bacteroidota bacterium]
MMFVHPAFLWALFTISVPIIIHLFNFRRYKKVYFTNVKFLKEIQHESKSKSRLKEILILIARCLTLACLVLAFSQPVLTDKNAKIDLGANAISIYIDNSFSMENVQKQGPLLSIAKLRAKDIVKAFGNGDKFQVITNDFEGRHQRFYSKEDVVNAIDEIKISASVKSLSSVLKRQNEFLNGSSVRNKKVYVLSDAQKSTFDLLTANSDTSIRTTLVPLSANQVNNVYIDSCWFETPLQQKGFIQKLHAIVVNMGGNPVNAGSAKLFINKVPLAIASYSLDPMSKKEIQFTFEAKEKGFNFGSIKLEDYPISHDDELFFSFNSEINISVTLINGKEFKGDNNVEDLFTSDSLFRLHSFSEQAIDFSTFKSSDVIVLNELSGMSSGLLSEISKFMSQGGSLLIIPSTNADIDSYNQFLGSFQLPALQNLDTFSIKTDKIETANKFYTGVFEKMEDRINLPLITKHYKTSRNSKSNFENILTLQNGDVLLGLNRFGNGSIYLSSAPLNDYSGNFGKHALFVPTIYRICFNSLKASQLFYEVHSNNVISLKNEASTSEQPPHIKELNNKSDIIPEIHQVNNSMLLYTRSQISSPGFYQVIKNNMAVLPLAFNYSRTESDLACYASDELIKMISDKGWKNFSVMDNTSEDISKQILEEAQGKKLWKLFIILALSFVLLEILLLRFLK